MSSTTSTPWDRLPTEMKFNIVELLDVQDVRAFANVNKEAYSLAVPAMWRAVELKNLEAMQSYLGNVPPSYHRYTRQLSICTKSVADHPTGTATCDRALASELCIQLLSQCPQLEQCTLHLQGALDHAVISCFENLHDLRVLSINHCGDEQQSPLSERLVVSIAASVPHLTELSLDKISRSAVHAPELIGVCPFVPVVTGDEMIPPHALLGSELSLPSLLRLPTLKKLRIRDTHLGDRKWENTPIHCSLQYLDLGSCCYETQDFNRICTETIVGKVGKHVDQFSLNTAISTEKFAFEKPKETPFSKLRKIHLTPLFPVENVVDTLTTLSGSPIEELSVRCLEDDVDDMCSALEDFLTIRVERSDSDFYKHLSQIKVSTVKELYDDDAFTVGADAHSCSTPCVEVSVNDSPLQRLQEYLKDIRASCDASVTVGGKGTCPC